MMIKVATTQNQISNGLKRDGSNMKLKGKKQYQDWSPIKIQQIIQHLSSSKKLEVEVRKYYKNKQLCMVSIAYKVKIKWLKQKVLCEDLIAK